MKNIVLKIGYNLPIQRLLCRIRRLGKWRIQPTP